MRLIFTDLDGTLLDAETYSYEPAGPALERLRETGSPLVLVTSKTRAEVELWRWRLKNNDPFIVENGGAIFVPRGCFSFAVEGAVRRDGYEAIELGERYERLVEALAEASKETGCRVAGFHDMSVEEVAGRCDLPLEQARLAKARAYDEAFEVLDPEKAQPLTAAIERRGYRWTRGGRFYHVMGGSDKRAAVARLSSLYREAFGDVKTIGLGDAPNDAGFLNLVEEAVLIRSESVGRLQKLVPRGRVTRLSGPAGWNEAVLELLRTDI
jgi:mannosyl-3-phosphoglycerate phosphatase